MRIRKRIPPSSLSPLPLSDPQLSRSPVVQNHLQGGAQPDPDGNLCVQEDNACSQPSDPPNQVRPPPYDRNPAIGSARPRWVCSDGTRRTLDGKQKEMDDEEAGEERLEEEEKSKNTRKGSIIGAELGSCLLPKASSSHQEVWTWCEGDKIVPLKKRRRSFESRGDDRHGIMEKETKRKTTKMKSKTNKKCVKLPNGDEKGGKETELSIKNTGSKKVKRGNVIMEGSRCSRVNGRGWRCCQPTLVGYSLCEHHLGKGRLRSVTSVRANAPKKDDDDRWGGRLLSSSSSLRKEKWLAGSLSDDDVNEDDEDDEEEEKKAVMIAKKRMKIGTVKARSMSSLLGQTNNAVAVASDSNKTVVYMNEDNGKY